MKTKLFLAAIAFSFTVISCSGNKTANSVSDTDSTTVETVDAAVCTESKACCKTDSCNTDCEKKADCTEKKSCCDKK